VNGPELAPLEQALLDFARVGLSEDGSGFRQLCRRLIRTPPKDATHPASLRAELSALLAAAPTPATGGLRRTATVEREAQWDEVASTSPSVRRATRGTGRGLVNMSARDLVARRNPYPEVTQPVLGKDALAVVHQLVAERRATARLAEAGLDPSKTLLLVGPPGVGKTLTASYIASQLELPLITVDLASVMSSYLGKTGRNIRDALDDARQEDSVVLLDEFDALAKRRNDDADIGELKRLVNVLLQQLDQWPASRLLIAATNHPELLDRAVTRRFDVTLELSLPTAVERELLLERIPLLRRFAVPTGVIELLALATEGYTHAAVEQWVTSIGRRAVVSPAAGATLTTALTEHAVEKLRERAATDTGLRQRLANVAHHELKLSLRKTAALLGCSHPTVRKDLASVRSQLPSLTD
jgi:dephospho-CoA kinase